MKRLINKTAVITGGNSGMGLTAAKALLQEGATVIITGRNEKAIDDALSSLGSDKAHGILSDTSKWTELETLQSKIKKITSKIDVLFVNAGIIKFSPVAHIDETSFDEIINTNFKGAVFTIKNLLPLFTDGGSIIINSTSGTGVGLPNTAVYTASKSALEGFSKVLASEVAAQNIRVNVVKPGAIDTPIFSKAFPAKEVQEQAKKQFASKTVLNRVGLSEEIAQAVVFLASADSSYITGTEIVIDGGFAINPFV